MAEQKLQYTVKARRADQGVLRAVLGDLGKFSSSAGRLVSAPFRAITSLRGIGLAANIQLLRGLGHSIEQLVERGTRLEVVRKSFESLSGAAGPAAGRLARQLQEAAQGTITQARAMEIANRALASGLSQGDLRTALEFISKKAVTTGKSAAAAIDTVITGLSRGSTLFLDDFGVLVDGVDGVTRDFNRIKGAGAFEQLGPAAQKAEVIRAAMVDMRKQLGSIGISGRESSFQLARIQNALSDSVDKVLGAVAGSKRFQGVLKDVAAIATSVANALGGPDQDKALDKLISGAKELLGAVFVDAGRLLAKGLIEAAQVFGPALLEGVQAVGTFLLNALIVGAAKFTAAIGKLVNKIPGFGGTFDTKAIAAAEAAQFPGAPAAKGLFDFQHHGVGEEVGKALRNIAGQFVAPQVGKDGIERIDKNASLRLFASERRKLQSELTVLFREKQTLALPNFVRQARGELQAGQILGVDPKRLSDRERDEVLRRRGRELMTSRLSAIAARERDIRQRLSGKAPAEVAARGAAVAPVAGPAAPENRAQAGIHADLLANLLQVQDQPLFGNVLGQGMIGAGGKRGIQVVPGGLIDRVGKWLSDIMEELLDSGRNAPHALPRGSGADVIPFVEEQGRGARILGLQMMREEQQQQGAPGGGVIENLLPWIPQAGTKIGPGGRGAGLMGGMLERIMDALLGNMSPMSPHGPLELWREPEELVPFGGGPGVDAQPRGGRGAGEMVANASTALMGAAMQLQAAAATNQRAASAFDQGAKKLARAVADI